MDCRRRCWAMRRSRYKPSIVVFAAVALLLTMSFARIAERGSRWRGVGSSAMLHAVRPTAKLVVTGTTELDASFILQKDSNLLGTHRSAFEYLSGDRSFKIRS